MARQLLKDVHPICAEILEGHFDEILDAIEQSARHRAKVKAAESGIRVGAIVNFTNSPKVKDLAGQYGVVTKVNKKSVAVAMLLEDGVSITAEGVKAYDVPLPAEWRVSPSLVEVVESDEVLERRAYETRKVLAYWAAA